MLNDCASFLQISKNKVWKPILDLCCIDRRVVKKGMVTDRHMHAVNQMLQTQFPDIQSLQSTLKSQTNLVLWMLLEDIYQELFISYNVFTYIKLHVL